MSRITITVEKQGLALEAGLSKLTREIQKNERLGYHLACAEAEKRFDYTAFKQIIHSDSNELDLGSLGEHIAHGAPFKIERG